MHNKLMLMPVIQNITKLLSKSFATILLLDRFVGFRVSAPSYGFMFLLKISEYFYVVACFRCVIFVKVLSGYGKKPPNPTYVF